MRSIAIFVTILALSTGAAEARHRHHHRGSGGTKIVIDLSSLTPSQRQAAEAYAKAAGVRYHIVRGR